MLFLLDNDKKIKLDILNAIYTASYHRISFHTLQQNMKLSTVTLTTALSQLIDDIEEISTESIILEYRYIISSYKLLSNSSAKSSSQRTSTRAER